MFKYILLSCILFQLFAANSQTVIHQSTKVTNCIIDQEDFNLIESFLDVQRIKKLDEEHETTSQEDIDNYKIVISLNESDGVGKFSVYGGDSVERHGLVIIEVEDISENTKRYLIRDESAPNEDGFYLITSEDKGSSNGHMVMYMESEVRNNDKWRTVIIYEEVVSARLKSN